MSSRFIKLLTLLLALTLIVPSVAHAGLGTACTLDGTAPNDILTFKDNSNGDTIVILGSQYYMPDDRLADTLTQAFPGYLFVLDHSATSGVESEDTIPRILADGVDYDIMIFGDSRGLYPFMLDLSAESFLDNYLLSALNAVSKDGRIYCIPGTSTLTGIAFNADMFEANGWEVPETHEEFFELCEKIKATGVAPFSTCAKYISQLNQLFCMLCYSELFGTLDGAIWLEDMLTNRATYEGFAEPMFELVKRFADDGLMTIDDFTASLTKQRQDFWAGKYAMIDYSSTIFTYAQAENAQFNLGIMPYPSKEFGGAGFAITPEYYFGILSDAAKDPGRRDMLRSVLAYISSPEGQQLLMQDSLRVSNVRNVDLSDNPAMKYVLPAYMRGNFYPTLRYFSAPDVPVLTLQQNAMRMLFEGAQVKDSIEYMDKSLKEAFALDTPAEPVRYDVIARAEKGFTMLEASYYMADKLREASGADVALMPNRGYFRSNLATIPQGDITTDMRRFIMKGMDQSDCLTVYSITGAQLRALMEHPVINGQEIDALIAASGLEIEYAPWNERGSRVLSLKLEGGAPIEDDAVYSVAAFSGAIDAMYITDTVETFESLGTLTDILLAAFKTDGTITPDLSGRLTLYWPQK